MGLDKFQYFPLLFFISLLSIFVVACGFIGEIFGGHDKATDDDQLLYTLTLHYRYEGSIPVSPMNPIHFIFLPLDEDRRFNEQSFMEPKSAVAFIPTGTVSVDLSIGHYAIMGFVDADGNGELNHTDYYAFFFRKDVVSTLNSPDFIWIDRYVEEGEDTPYYFEFGDDFLFPELFILSPMDGDTVEGVKAGFGDNRFFTYGIAVVDSIDYVATFVDGIWIDNRIVDQDNSWSMDVKMHSRPTGIYSLEVRGYSGSIPAEEPITTPIRSYGISIGYISP